METLELALPVAWRTSLRECVGSVIITDVPQNLVYVARSRSETKAGETKAGVTKRENSL